MTTGIDSLFRLQAAISGLLTTTYRYIMACMDIDMDFDPKVCKRSKAVRCNL